MSVILWTVLIGAAVTIGGIVAAIIMLISTAVAYVARTEADT